MADNKNQNTPIIHMRPGGPGGPGRGGPMAGRVGSEKPKNAKATIGRIIRYIGKSKYMVLALLVMVILTAAVNLAGPTLQANAIDAITIDIEQNKLHVDFEALVNTLIIMGILYVIASGATMLQGVLASKLSQSTVHNMRNELFRKISYLPIKYTDTHKHGDIMSRMTNDVENISNTVSQSIASLFSSVITVIGAFVLMISYSPILTLVAMVSIPLTIFASNLLVKHMRKYFSTQSRLLGALNGHIEEMVTGYKTVMAFGKEQSAIDGFEILAQDYRKISIKANIWGSIMGPVMNIIGNFSYLLLAAVGGYMIAVQDPNGANVLTIGAIQAVLGYSKQFTRPINEIANQYSSILTAIAGAERVFEILDNENEIDKGTKKIDVKGDISFKNIHFSYVPGESVLRDFDLEVKSGQKIAIVGATGSGKTTVVNLLTRFYEIDSGEILLDGVNINDIPKKDLRETIAIVLQDTVLFADTIDSNIRYGKLEASEDEVKAAAHCARADVFIERLPEAYHTVLAGAGSNLSVGQRQLLSIARAVLADPKILILDEATSSVDTQTEMNIQSAMVALMKGRTSLIIAHRLSTIRDADKIIVLDGGKIAEAGSHEELIERGGAYYRLYQSQFAGIAT
ncbi:MAG: ABC transporter ATP-binding protein [Ruminococcaceae bacterium]|nr:ABC transporter ATP-binding protein [Oscillospiraceae bacterium]